MAAGKVLFTNWELRVASRGDYIPRLEDDVKEHMIIMLLIFGIPAKSKKF